MRSNYWGNSRFADWLRGTPKGSAKTADDWHTWEKQAQAAHPVRYWIAEEALDGIQNFIWWPVDKIYNLKYYINNRWVTRTHCLTAHPRDLKRGQWCDVGYRFLPCLFNELVDYVEMELAWWHIAWDDEAKKKFQAPFWSRGFFRWRVWRCPEAGLENLRWQMSLTNNGDWIDENDPDFEKPTQQALNAREIYELYKWWTEVYRNRPDAHDASGWSEYCELKRKMHGDETLAIFRTDVGPELKAMAERALEKTSEIEAAYEKEDEEMMIRLIKVRGALWT